MKKEYEYCSGTFWRWLKANLPHSLIAREIGIGYGYEHLIYASGNERTLMEKVFEDRGDPVAEVFLLGVTIYHPEYESTFDDLIVRWEKETGKEVEVTVWQGR